MADLAEFTVNDVTNTQVLMGSEVWRIWANARYTKSPVTSLL